MPTKTRVYGPPRGLVLAATVAAACLAGVLGATTPGRAQSELDCARPSPERDFIARLRLAEIEGAEDIHRAAMWDAFGRCPEGAAGGPCRLAERRRFEAEWEGKQAQIEAKYRAILGEFELRCRASISRLGRRALRAAS